jgi:hypothetical protein
MHREVLSKISLSLWMVDEQVGRLTEIKSGPEPWSTNAPISQGITPGLLKSSQKPSIPCSNCQSRRTWPSDSELENGRLRDSQTRSSKEDGAILDGEIGFSIPIFKLRNSWFLTVLIPITLADASGILCILWSGLSPSPPQNAKPGCVYHTLQVVD